MVTGISVFDYDLFISALSQKRELIILAGCQLFDCSGSSLLSRYRIRHKGYDFAYYKLKYCDFQDCDEILRSIQYK